MADDTVTEFANYFYVRHAGSPGFMDNYVFSKIIINNFQISILDGQTDNSNVAHYNIDLTKFSLKVLFFNLTHLD